MTLAGEGLSDRKKSLTCHTCGKTFESEQILEEHKKLEHGLSQESPAGVG